MADLIDSTAKVSIKAQIGKNVTIGPFTIVHDNVTIGDDTVIGSHCEIGLPTDLAENKQLVISQESYIRSHSIFYEGSSFKQGLVTGHRVCVRENIVAGERLQIGSMCDLQGNTTIGNHARFQSNVFVPKHTKIGNFVWFFPGVILTNDPHPPSNYEVGPTIEDFAVLAAGSIVLPEITIKYGSLIGAGSLVNKDTEKNMIYTGIPAKKVGPTSNIKLREDALKTSKSAYPWKSHFHRGYPDEIVNKWRDES